jgi:hypothetical protein
VALVSHGHTLDATTGVAEICQHVKYLGSSTHILKFEQIAKIL